MTFYNYLEEMQVLCLRAARALKVIKPEDPVIYDVYTASEEGFFNRKRNCLVTEGECPAGDARTGRLEEFRDTVQQWEDKAAYRQKEQQESK